MSVKNIRQAILYMFFEQCSEVQRYALDTSEHYAAVVSKNNLRMTWPNNFIVFVPPTFRIADSTKCYFAKLEYMTEY